ncbi:MAG: DNA-directed RNA polymerase subunit omega [Deltaproteobacteria bacterium]|nr:DNA-directed RNA polymerase subunit omega [Candidatus Zymogenaceae bacterium]
MARITVEDCLDKVDNRFELVHLAAMRTKQLRRGSALLVGSTENKDIVRSLREIAAGKVNFKNIQELKVPDEDLFEAYNEEEDELNREEEIPEDAQKRSASKADDDTEEVLDEDLEEDEEDEDDDTAEDDD